MVFQRVWGGLSSAPSGPATDDDRAFLQKRIAFFGRVGMLLALASYVFTHAALMLEPGGDWGAWIRPDALLYLLNASLLGSVWVITRGPARGLRTLASLDACGSFLGCASAAL
jgi:hypothetical protein